MMTAKYTHVHSLAGATTLLLLFSHVNAGGYYYTPPAQPALFTPPSTPLHAVNNADTGHYFRPLPTIAPLPPVPALPPLPTPRTQTLLQVHPGYRPPLRIPFGKHPSFSNYGSDPDEQIYVINGRHLKQYHVVEFVDNDISQETKPFIVPGYSNAFRAQVGASGTGATVPLPTAMQLTSTADAVLLEQQRLAQQGQAGKPGDTIALGSGGIGYVQRADGTIYLGSGSLNFVSAQQHLENLRKARTRTEFQPDALHFGPSPIEEPSNQFRFK